MIITEEAEVQIGELQVGMLTYGPTGRVVKIVDGAYLRADPFGVKRVSNFWYWRTADENGLLGPIESGYGWQPRKPTV